MGYRELATAVIAQAAQDYRDTLSELRVCPDDQVLNRDKREIEAFFRSKWYEQLTPLGVSGEEILRGLSHDG